MLFVDAGDFTGDDTWAGRRQTEALIEGMNALGYRVANLSQRELAHGYDTFLERQPKAQFKFVSANIVWQDSGEPLVDPTTVLTVPLREGAKTKEVRVGFIGLTRNNPAFLKEGPEGRRIVTIDHLQAATKHLPALRKQADVVVALVSMDPENARQVARTAKDIDLILGGQGGLQTRSDDFPEDTKFGRTRLMAIGDQGKAVGEVRLTFDAARAIVANQRHIVQLGREWPDDAVLAALMEKTKVAINDHHRQQADIASPFAPARTAGAPAASPAGQTPGAAPGAAVPVAAVPRAAAQEPPQARDATYTGSARCAECHEEAFGIWQGSRHAHAFDTLVKQRQDYNPQCVGCHTIGFKKSHGFVDATATPGLVHVGCESCHGPSSLHPETMSEGYGATDTGACRTCHTADNSPDYKPAEYIPKIRHWSDGAAGR